MTNFDRPYEWYSDDELKDAEDGLEEGINYWRKEAEELVRNRAESSEDYPQARQQIARLEGDLLKIQEEYRYRM